MSLVFSILSIILAIAATVLAFIFIVPEKAACRRNGFGSFVHNLLTFKVLILEKILQALYIFFTAWVIFQGFFMLFMVTGNDWVGYSWQGGWGLLTMILGPILIRIIYEASIMFVLLVKNVIELNKNVKKIGGIEDTTPAPTYTARPIMNNPAPQPTAFCANCGAPKQDGQPCPRCGR